MTRALCSGESRLTSDGQHSVEMVDGVAVHHYAIPGQTVPCPGAGQPPGPGNRLPWADKPTPWYR